MESNFVVKRTEMYFPSRQKHNIKFLKEDSIATGLYGQQEE